jgi:RNA polymerase sigma-70 factor (ECF subfamily)
LSALDRAAREHGGRVIAALAARFRDLDLAEEAYAEACARAVSAWAIEPPQDGAAWLYRVAQRVALDLVRKRNVRASVTLPDPEPEPSAEERLMDDATVIPDERLRLIFVCCHPAIAPDARAALTLRLVCGLSTAEIARAFLIPEPTLAQRLVRAKHKIAAAGIAFEVPTPPAWYERLEAVLITLDVAYSRAHADAGGTGVHAGYAREMLQITSVLAQLLPNEPDVLALAATVRFAESRRSARTDRDGMMIPLIEQDPADWNHRLIEEGHELVVRGAGLRRLTPRLMQALIHAQWSARESLDDPPPWREVLGLYDAMLRMRNDPVVRLNRAVALAEVEGAAAALEEVDALDHPGLAEYLPYHAVRADLLARLNLHDAARGAYDAALALAPEAAERQWLEHQRACLE